MLSCLSMEASGILLTNLFDVARYMSMDGDFNDKFTFFIIKKTGALQQWTYHRTQLHLLDSWAQHHLHDCALHGIIFIDFPRHSQDNQPNRLIMQLWNKNNVTSPIHQMYASSVNNYTLWDFSEEACHVCRMLAKKRTRFPALGFKRRLAGYNFGRMDDRGRANKWNRNRSKEYNQRWMFQLPKWHIKFW